MGRKYFRSINIASATAIIADLKSIRQVKRKPYSMSTTFQVYPQTSYIPSFKEVVAVSQQKLNLFLEDYSIKAHPPIAVQLRSQEPDTILSLPWEQPAIWSQECYAWFHFPLVGGGTDAYFSYLDPEDREYWNERCQTDEWVAKRQELVLSCLTQGYFWRFRRSMGQSGLINLTYGLVAASFAELTDGFIYSEDGAWDYERFPATAQEFCSWYFRPAQAIRVDYKNWAERCLGAIVEKLRV